MNIADNILKYYLQNCYFINGTAYAGKSTMCSMLAEKYDMIHCEENYNMDTILSVVTPELQPDLNYFNENHSMHDFVSRSPEEYERWCHSVSREVTEFEIAELIRLSASGKKIIVDTCIPCDVLHRISDYNHVAIMLSSPDMAVAKFFDRSDAEKRAMLDAIESGPEPEKTLETFRQGIARMNSQEVYDQFADSGFFTLVRPDDGMDTRDEMIQKLAKHFGLEKRRIP